MIEIVSATRMTKSEFLAKSALGLSLHRISYDDRLTVNIKFENKRGLPEIYNERIDSAEDSKILVFIHDDVWIDDIFFVDRVIGGLDEYDVIGVAGNRRRVPYQSAWAFIDNKWDHKDYLSGGIAHGANPFGDISAFGSTPADCELLDGVFLAAKKETLQLSQALFDPRFDFHFYDMDFCRTARMKGLRLGTWPISLTHQSAGAFGSPSWQEKYRLYQEKWKN